MNKKICSCVFLVCLGLQGESMASPDDAGEEKKVIMQEVVVTATRANQQYQKVPASVTVITAQDIASSGAQTVPELLASIPGIVVLDLDGTGLFQKVDIGGFGDTADRHIAVTVNGRKINPVDLSNVSWAALPVENIERVEVLYGGGSVLYGDNAVGGVVNIITKQATGEGVHPSAQANYGSFNTASASAAIDVVKGAVGLYAGLMHHETDGFREHSSNRRRAFFSDLRFDATDNTTYFARLNLKSDEYELPDALTLLQLEQDRRQASPDSTGQGNGREAVVSGGFEHQLSVTSILKLDLSVQKEERESRWQGTYFGFPWSSQADYTNKSLTLSPQYVLTNPLAGHDNRFIAGIDFFDVDYTSISSYGYTFEVDRRVYSLYAQNEFQLYDHILLQVGARYEKPDNNMSYRNPGSSVRSHATLNDEERAFDLGLSYAFAAQSKIYTRIYRAFRYPRVDEFVSLFNGSFNTNLKQESAVGYEAGLHWADYDNLDLRLRAFVTDVSNEIVYNDASGLNVNIDGSRRIGAEVNFIYRFTEAIILSGGVANIRAEITSGPYDAKEIPLVPAWKGNLGLELHPFSVLTASMRYNFVDTRYLGNDFQNTQDQLDAYQTVDLAIEYNIHRNAVVYLSARNIFNEKYENGYYDTWGGEKFYPMPEAQYLGGLRLSF
jgi:iron complex outermembrane receptor protein